MPDHRAIDGRAIQDTEWDLLGALWEGGPATATQVAERLESSRGWAYSTVKTLLDRMAEKGLVKARRVGNVWEYAAALEPSDARKSAWKRFVAAAFGGAVAPALQFIAKDAPLTPKQRDELLKMLKEDGDDR